MAKPPLIIQQGRRSAEIEGAMVRLRIRDNKRKPPRPVLNGERKLLTPLDAFHSGFLWVIKGNIDFGDTEPQQH